MTRSILLVISGGIAAYKSLELIRLMRKNGWSVRVILTRGGAEFVTPLSAAALSEHPVYTDLFSLKDETEMGHIRLTREADAIIIAPASAGLIAKMANGLADDLASTTLLANNSKPVFVAPAMNPEMWNKPATQRNIATLKQDGAQIIDPDSGDMACGETGTGRMVEAADIFAHLQNFFEQNAPLKGISALVTSGPTFEPIDPVRFIGNRSSGKQGHAIASELAKAGANVTLVTGPVTLPDPTGVQTIHIETAQEMLAACEKYLPADIAVCAAAVADWRAENRLDHKMKKREGAQPPALTFAENPDILATLSSHKNRPRLVIGFAAETENAVQNAHDKLARKKCDWILANQVGKSEFPVFGTDDNLVTLITNSTTEDWPEMSKQQVAARLVEEIVKNLKG